MRTVATWTGVRLAHHVTSLYYAWPRKGFIDSGATLLVYRRVIGREQARDKNKESRIN
jgi:hypothetical protein